MAKLPIKNENVTPFGGSYHIMDVFSSDPIILYIQLGRKIRG